LTWPCPLEPWQLRHHPVDVPVVITTTSPSIAAADSAASGAVLATHKYFCFRLLEEHPMLFFVWYDDSPKKPALDKLQDAIVAYVERFKVAPSLVLVNAADKLELASVVVRCERTVQPNTFWLAYEDGIDAALTWGSTVGRPDAH
jgi:hypothetical protein